ncbi:hypothetical protein MVEN_01195700 [Mycena venus]|uniref:F-box domain-containing protein n=1 Tax=Mycena venus TaxID=2733690 RepID=A0A8H6Y1H3_9AGAR|nr:hypothetical protein MVEN_01195700 [Mycena venus]
MALSTNGKLRLQDLVEDVLILILAECDVAGVVAISVTSKFFHNLAFTNAIWYSLVTKLAQRGFIDRRPDDECLSDLSTEQLIDIVKGVLRGPSAWTDTHPESRSSRVMVVVRRAVNVFRKLVRKPRLVPAPTAPLVESRRIALHPEISFGMYWENKPMLLPGGKYMLFMSGARLECWSVFEDRLIWKHESSLDTSDVLIFDAELVEEDRAVVLTCQRTWAQPFKNFVEISTVNMESGVSCLELVSRVPDYAHDFPYVGCTVGGDTVAVYLFDWIVLLVNWRTSSRVLVLPDPSLIAIELVPGYLVLSLQDSCGECRLTVGPVTPLASWEPNHSTEEPSAHITAADLSTSAYDSITLTGRLCDTTRLWVYESPLREGRFKVWLYTDSRALCSYEFFKHAAGSGVSLRFLSLIRMPDSLGTPANVSLSGHTLRWRSDFRGLDIFPPVPASKKHSVRHRTVEFPAQHYCVYLSAFSGALTYATDDELVVLYYY